MADLLTASRKACFHACPRKHELRYELGIRRIRDDAEAPRFGNLLHAGAEAWLFAFRDGQPEEACNRALDAIDAEWESHAESDLYERERAFVLMQAYDLRWGDAQRRMRVLEVEREFARPLRNPDSGWPSRKWMQAGKVDAVVELPNGDRYLMEHKTTTEDITPGSNYFTRLRLDSQVSIYHDGAEAMGHEVRGCIYDVLVRPTQKPLLATPEASRRYTKGKQCKACKGEGTTMKVSGEYPCADCEGLGWKEAPRLDKRQREHDETVEAYGNRLVGAIGSNPEAWFQRIDVVRFPDELTDSRRDCWNTAALINACRKLGYWPRNDRACTQYHKLCEYFPACSGAASLDDPSLFERVELIHSELSPEIQGGK